MHRDLKASLDLKFVLDLSSGGFEIFSPTENSVVRRLWEGPYSLDLIMVSSYVR